MNWGALVRFKQAFFAKTSNFQGTVTRISSGAKKSKVDKKRLLWPCVMVCGIQTVSQAVKDDFEATLPLLGTGPLVLWSWFLALFEALQSNVAQLSCCSIGDVFLRFGT